MSAFSILRRRWRIVGVVAFLLIGLSLAAATWPEKFLTVEQEPVKADAIVLLGGGSNFRVPRALELFQQGFAPLIIISGKGDSDETRRWLKNSGVPVEALRCETNSMNTWQNAKFSASILREMKAHRVILVTSWFHSRRTLACFHKAAPEIEFVSLPTLADRPSVRALDKKDRGRMLYEYVKLAGYCVRYGVWPF
jgi:uncharacterized SAM-binding protein YcdF (DUF218 family)